MYGRNNVPSLILALAASSFIKMKAYLKNTAASYDKTVILDIRAKQIFKVWNLHCLLTLVTFRVQYFLL